MIVKKKAIFIFIFIFLLFNSFITIQAVNNVKYGYSNYNEKNNGDIIDIISIGEKNLTIRKLEQQLFIYSYEDKLNLRELPDITSEILFQLDENYLLIKTIAITKELETIDGLRDHWVKIITRNGKIGWVFGSYTSVDYYGPKYELPEIYEIGGNFLREEEFLQTEEGRYEEENHSETN